MVVRKVQQAYVQIRVDRGSRCGDACSGVNVTRSALGQCRHMNYAGTLYEERNICGSRALHRFLQEVSGNYTAYVCGAYGVMLSTAIVYDAPAYVSLKLKAVNAGPYNADTYCQIFQGVEERLRDAAFCSI